MEFQKVVLGEYLIFYNEQEKIIGRIPTPSNISLAHSDNSLYFGIYGATRGGVSTNVLENIIGVAKDDYSDHNYEMKWDKYDVKLHTNLNAEGQLQMKVIYDGFQSGVSKMVNLFIQENNMDNFDGYGIFIDFKRNRISCRKIVHINSKTIKTVSSRKNRAKKDLDQIMNEVETKYPNISTDEKNAYIDAHVHVRSSAFQKIYRGRLIKEFGCKCAICSINIKELLIASHIVSYKDCINNDERIDHNNGLLLCSLHDSLFDKGFISFDQFGKIQYKFDGLEQLIFDDLNINSNVSLEKKHLTDERKKYLLRHKRKF